MEHSQVKRLVVLLLWCAAVAGEEPVFFSLSSSSSWLPGEKAAVQLMARSVAALQFRVYRVNDPVRFFETLGDEHRFGPGIAPQGAGQRTALERFHRFKRSWRNWARNVVRAQFSSASRALLRGTPEQKRGPVADAYAAVPLLNPQRLVASWQERVTAQQRWESQTVRVDVHDKGLYLVEATDGRRRAYTIVLVSELAVLSKGAPGRVFLQVVNRRTGVPVENCPVVVLVDRKEVARRETRADGTLDLAIDQAEVQRVLLLARSGPDFAVESLYGHNIGTDPENDWRGYLYTDRPVYRPGHSVSFRGILRVQIGTGYAIPPVKEVDVTIEDPDAKPVLQKRMPVSAMGTLHGELSLPASAALGYYSISVRAGSASAYGGFHVEEYKKPEYDVKVTPDKRRVLQGEPLEATVEARYYFGEPVKNAKVAWVVHRSRYWDPEYQDEEMYGDEEDEGGWAGEQVQEGTGQLDDSGRVRVRLQNDPWTADARYRIEARVTDPANREISGAGSVLSTVGSFLLHVQPDQYVLQPGGTARITVEARDYDGSPVDRAFELNVTEWRWNAPEGKRVFSASGRTAGGRAQVETTLAQAGSYAVHAKAVTPEGRELQATAHLWVTGQAGSWYGARERLQIVPDRKSYKPGETARVLIVTGVPDAHVVVSAEGNRLHTVEVVKAVGPTVTVSVPIRREYAPNFFVTAAFIRDGQLYQGMKNISVPPTEHELKVELTSSKSEYKPGEPAVFRIRAVDSRGRPASAEFSLGVVDEAIYAVRREVAQELLQFFYGRGWNRVSTGSSLSYYFEGEAGTRAMQLTQIRRRNFAQLKPERFVDPRVRKAFPDTAFWVADLKLNADGQGEAQFDFPDALTTWRATARGITQDSKVGSAVQRVIVRKNLMLRLAAPRFFTAGDEVTVSALVHNYLGSAKTVRVSLDAQGARLIEGGQRDLQVASRSDARLDFRLSATAAKLITLLGKALTDEESDAMELTLPVIPYGVKYTEGRSGSISEDSGSATAELTFPPQAPVETRGLTIRVTPSLAGAILGALEYLTSYPYGCTEQTMSSFLPNVIVAQAARGLGLKTGIDEKELQKKIRLGLERLYGFQHEDGGWGWWKEDESTPFMTAYVLAGLAQAASADVRVDTQAMKRAADWLRPRMPGGDLGAYVAYARSLAGQFSAPPALDTLSPYGLALAGLALRQAGRPGAEEIADRLLKAVEEDSREAHWTVGRDTLMDFEGNTSAEATAYAVKLLAALRPDVPLLPKAIAWLVNHRQGGYYWNSTKQTAMVIYGIVDYLKRSGELKPDFKVTVTLNGRELLARTFAPGDALQPGPAEIRLGEKELNGAGAVLEFRKSGPGRLYWAAENAYYAAGSEPVRAGGSPLNVRRDYFKLVSAKEGGKIVYRLEPLGGAVSPGDVLAVRVSVQGPSPRYLFIEDPIPAGTEAIARDELYEVAGRPRWWGAWYTRRELHDDRVAMFQTWMERGGAEYSYLLKVVNAGLFRVSPARAGSMYEPERFSTSGPAVLEVR